MPENTTTPPKLTSKELRELVYQYQLATLPSDVSPIGDVDALANLLNVTADSLRRLGVGHDGRAFTFPMRDGAGKIIGITRRFPDRKLCLPGSRLGLFMPDDLAIDGHLLICEGASDTAAALTLGYEAIGLPSAGQGFDHVIELLHWHRHPRISIVADLDEGTLLANGDVSWPGIEGGIRLGERLMPMVDDLRFVLPPPRTKDLRQWLVSADANEIRVAIDRAPHVTCAWINLAWKNVQENRERLRVPSWERQASALLAKVDDPDLRADLRFQFEERIAICTIDGGLPEDEAARIAFEQIRQLLVEKGIAA